MKNKSKVYDILGFTSAFLCLVHCLVFPLLLIVPIGLYHNHYIDLLFAFLGIFALVKILKNESPFYIKWILVVSMSLILISIFYTLITNRHTYILYFGGFGMMIGHTLNFFKHKHR